MKTMTSASDPKPDAALAAAVTRVAGIERDPLAAAQLQIQSEKAVAGAYKLVQALVAEMGGGPVTLGRDAVHAPDPRKRLDVSAQPDGSVIITLVDRE